MKDVYFFTLRDFEKSGGGALRIKGMISALESNNITTTLISVAGSSSSISSNKININVVFNIFEKRILYFLMAYSWSFSLIDIIFYKKMKTIKTIFCSNQLIDKEIIFCEYLDNALGYYLKKKRVINKYYVDLHGVAHIEFLNYSKESSYKCLVKKFKYYTSLALDRKVLGFSDLIVFASNAMRDYLITIHPNIEKIKYRIIPYYLSSNDKLFFDDNLFLKIQNKYSIEKNDDVIFFAGGFTKIGGIFDLVHAFNEVSKIKHNAKLFLLGGGDEKTELMSLVNKYNLKNKVVFAGTIPYEYLFTYQSLANVIICPDTNNTYSNLIVHLKYYDSLRSGKIVINGSFLSVLEANKNDDLSISFEPSNIQDLSDKIIKVLNNKKILEKKYSKNINFVSRNFLYENITGEIHSIWKK